LAVNSNWSIPNALTLLRIVLAAAGAWLARTPESQPIAVWLLIAAALLDAFDGWYARAFAQSTRLGKHLDPFADKVLVAVIMVWLGVDANSVVAWWLIGVSLARDAAMTLLRMYSARIRRQLIPASALGRWKMFLQCSGGLVILSFTHVLGWRVGTGWVIGALAVMLAVSVAAMVGYLKAKGSAADHEQTHFALRSPG
jgi:CDP-diacylglycerol--glycerol-3-phosphate 3-phosphatidyltransferase